MKIGNIKEIVSGFATKFREYKVSDREDTASFEYKIKALPKNNLDKWFQERYNKPVDYDQWVGIRDELDRMGRILYEKSLTVIGDAIITIQAENQDKIENLEQKIRELDLEVELKKYVD